jgi:hypothetical protein
MKKSGRTQHRLKIIIYSDSYHRDEYSINSQGRLTVPLPRSRNLRDAPISPISSAKSSSDSSCPPQSASPVNNPELGFTPVGAGSPDFSANWIDESSNESFASLSSFEDFDPFFFVL